MFRVIFSIALTILFLQGCSVESQIATQPESEGTQNGVRANHSGLNEAYAEFRSENVSHVSYELTIDIYSEEHKFAGEVTVNFNLIDKHKEVTLDFQDGDVLKLVVNGEESDFAYNGNFITVPHRALIKGDNTLTVKYQHDFSNNGTGLHKFTDPEDGNVYLYSYLWPYYANLLFPSFDQPNIKAHYKLTVLAPKEWEVVTSVRETNIIEAARYNEWQFPTSKNFSTYIFSLHAGPYTVWEDNYQNIPLRLFARQALADNVPVEEWFATTKRGMAFYSNYFEIDYSFRKYDQLLVPDFNIGAMENVAAITFTEELAQYGPESVMQRQLRDDTIVHELSHQWFGNLVTNAWWNGLWLNESFATLVSSVMLSDEPEYKDLWHDFYLSKSVPAMLADAKLSTHPIEVPVTDVNDFQKIFDTITYSKGAAVLNQLSHYVGQDNFQKGIALYLKKHSWQNTHLQDFMNALASVSDMDLKAWSDDWLLESGYNQLVADFTCQNGLLTHLTINQSGTPLREHKLQIALFEHTSSHPTVLSPVTVSGAQTSVQLNTQIGCPALVFPNYGNWTYAEVKLDDKSAKNSEKLIKQSSDQLLKSMLIQSKLNSQDVDWGFVTETIAAEYNQRILEQLFYLLNARLNILERQQTSNYLHIFEQVEIALWNKLKDSELPAQTQRLVFEQYLRSVRSRNETDRSQEMLESNQLLGETLSQAERWNILIHLASLRDVSSMIDNESERDSTLAGKRAQVAARASLPIREIKHYWLNVLLADPQTAEFGIQRGVMNNLFPVNQSDLQYKVMDALIAGVPQITEKRSSYFKSVYADRLFANVCEQKTLSKLQVMLATKDLDSTIARFVADNVQSAQQCIAGKK